MKYMLTRTMLTRINENSSATRIIKDVNILISTKWSQEARKEVTGTKIKNCFKKCGVVRSNDGLMEVVEDELGFEALVRELSRDMSATEYVYFDAYIPTFESMINEHEIDWRERLREVCANGINYHKVFRLGCCSRPRSTSANDAANLNKEVCRSSN